MVSLYSQFSENSNFNWHSKSAGRMKGCSATESKFTKTACKGSQLTQIAAEYRLEIQLVRLQFLLWNHF